MDEADYDLAYAKYQERFADAGDFNFYFVGNIDEAKLKEFAKTYIGSLPGKNSNETFNVPDFRVKDEYQKVVVNKGTDPKSQVQLVWVEETSYDPEEALELDALGEVLTIKLIEQLREEIGGVYGVGANGSLRKYPYGNATFSISFPCGPDNVEKLTEAALAEVEKLKENGPTAEDLAKVKETYLQERKDQMQKNAFWLSVLQDSDKEDKDITMMMSFEDRVNALTAEELKAVANKYLDDNYFMGVLMPEETE